MHRRARWPWVVLVIVVVLAALLIVTELVARAVVPAIVRCWEESSLRHSRSAPELKGAICCSHRSQ